jgi:hypothetical protein
LQVGQRDDRPANSGFTWNFIPHCGQEKEIMMVGWEFSEARELSQDQAYLVADGLRRSPAGGVGIFVFGPGGTVDN